MPHANKPSVAVSTPPMLPRPFKILRAWRETRDTYSLEMKAEEGSKPLEFRPGQFQMLYAFGIGEAAVSISGAGSRPGSVIHTLRSVGPVTGALARMKARSIVGARGPFGNSWPLEEARGKDIVLMAGGIGLAPLRPAIHEILANREAFGRVSILYGARSPSDILYRREIEGWKRRLDVNAAVTVDRSESDWRGPVGVVTALLAGIHLEAENTLALLCGPEIMMRFCGAELVKRGLSPDCIHLSMERNMKCAVGFCGHCQLGPEFLCKNGPVFSLDRVGRWLSEREF